MIKMEIPGRGTWEIENLVLDFNGTIAKDGRVNPKVKDKINLLGKKLKVYVLTADTRGDVAQRMVKMRAELVRLKEGSEAEQKGRFVRELGPERTVAIGNGYNDHLMVKEAILGIAVIGREGAAKETVMNADVVVTEVLDALDLILKPLRHRATLRA